MFVVGGWGGVGSGWLHGGRGESGETGGGREERKGESERAREQESKRGGGEGRRRAGAPLGQLRLRLHT